MEAKDTVIEGKIVGIHPCEQAVVDGLLLKQAGITWHDAIKEVVEFVVSDIFPMLKIASVSVQFKDKWNSQIKKWGIEEANRG